LLLAGGGGATVLVAVFPQPVRGNSVAHTIAASAAFVALATWPLFAAHRKGTAPLLTRPVEAATSVVLLGLVVWFAAELHASQRGLAERAAAGAQALWPLAVVVTTRRALARAAAA
jgi:hypothetical protein